MKKFNLYILCRKDKGGFNLNEEDVFVHPGVSSPVNAKLRGARLLSGFPGLYGEQDAPVSPALQLNADLGSFGPEMLLDIAKAELSWKEHVLFRSFILEPDPRVAVFSDDATVLANFVDTWGGLLAITPVLTKGYHPAFITASAIDLEKKGHGLSLRVDLKSPFDIERCSYCGFCGSSCPEECLKEMLFLDFDRCTLCMACVEACPNGAIDLHASESVEFEVAAILCLSGVEIGCDKGHPSVYRHDEIDKLVSTVCKRQVEEVITLDPFMCQHSTRSFGGCTKCMDVCEDSAISLGESGLEIDHLKCQECGRCVSVCPTGALQYERFNDRAFSSYVAQLEFKPGTKVVIGCAKVLHAFWWQNRTRRFQDTLFIEYPQVNALGLFHMLLLISKGASQVVIMHDGKGLDGPCVSQMALSNRIMEVLFHAEESVVAASAKEASDLLRPSKAHFSGQLPSEGFRSRRRALERILLFLVEHGSGQGHVEPGLSASFGTLVCDTSLCTHCLSCLNECRQGALMAHEEAFTISFKPILCVQCGLCAALCPEDALRLEPGLGLEAPFFKREVLMDAEPARCRNCGKVFGTRKSLEKVKSILSARQDLDIELFEYCDECRVKRFFEQEEEG